MRNMYAYKSIYEKFYGIIPKDKDGRSYDIHHIDGNCNNNDPGNLIALSIIDHFWEHWIDGDYKSCQAISMRMNMTVEERSLLATQSNLKRVQDGTHPWLDGSNTRERNLKRSIDGVNPFAGENGSKLSKRIQKKRLENGTHMTQIKIKCFYCGKICDSGNHARHHGDKCKFKVEAV